MRVNIKQIKDEIGSVKLVAVSKTKPVEEIKQFTLPDISKQFDNQEKVEQKKQANFKRPTAPQIPKFNKQSQDKPKKDLSKFEDEDRFVGMPEV